ncbi:hypothetical protein [Luedemannella flava]|uniref:hypothetical protein n=1 Tax=Luedemannella flava TaxID=349316 RepID=UPI0031D4269B
MALVEPPPLGGDQLGKAHAVDHRHIMRDRATAAPRPALSRRQKSTSGGYRAP